MEVTENKAIVHHVCSPSSLERRELCPGSFRLEKDLPQVESEISEEGKQLHAEVAELITYLVENGKRPEPEQYDLLSYQAFFKFYDTLMLEYEAGNSAEDVLVERRLEFKYAGIVQYYGFSDVVAVFPDKVLVVDFKFGYLPVTEAENNMQGAAYALAAMQEFKKEKAEVLFINPRINQHTFCTFDDRAAIASYIMGVIAKCKEENAPLIPGEKQCKYCKASAHGTCPALYEEAENTVAVAEKLLPKPTLAELSIDDLCALKERCDIIAKLGERVDNRIKAICETDGACGGYFLKVTSGGREITDINAAYDRISGDVEAGEFLTACNCSVSKLEKLYAAKMKAAGRYKTEKEGKAVFADIMAELLADKPPRKVLTKK